MNARIPVSFLKLPKREQELIKQYINEEYAKQLDEGEAELQIIWLKLCCKLMHDNFRWGEDRLYQFLGDWKQVYHWNAGLKDEETQAKALDEEMRKIFKKSGFPTGFINSLK